MLGSLDINPTYNSAGAGTVEQKLGVLVDYIAAAGWSLLGADGGVLMVA